MGFPGHDASEELFTASSVLCIHIGLLCVQDCPSARPLMSLVVSMMDNEAMPLTTPEQPLYSVGRKHDAEEAREDSINNASLMALAGR